MTLEQAKRYLLERARELGIDVEILAAEDRKLTLNAFEGKLNESSQATQAGIGLRVVSQGKVGYASTEQRTRESLDWALSEAKENAELQSNGGGFLPQGAALGKTDLLSEGLSAPVEDKAAAAIEFEGFLRKDERLKQVTIARYMEDESIVTLASTKQADGGYRTGYSALLGWYVMQAGDSLKQGFDYSIKREFHALDPGVTAGRALMRTGRHLGARPLKTGKYTAYLESRAVAQLLAVFLFMINGKMVMEGKSRLKERLGERVTSDLITMIDDPTLSGGLASRPFDSEGTPAKPVTVIDKGILQSFLHNSETAAALREDNTGHAQRSYKSTLGVGPSNFYLATGAGVDLGDGVIVTDLMGVHAGANPISGDVSVQALGLEVKGGEVAGPVENFAISGNLLEMLGRVTSVGDSISWEFQGSIIGAPMLAVPDVSFGGG